jgi:hypothetical protein
MRHVMSFHPEWGCLAPAPSLIRTTRTVLVATAVGALAGGGVVLSLGTHSAEGQTSVAERTLVAVSPAGSTSSRASQRSPDKMSLSESKEVWLPEKIQVDDPPTNESNTSSPARPEIVTSSAKVRMTTNGTSAKIAVVPSPTIQRRPKHLAQRAHHKDFVSSSPPLRHSLASRTDSNVLQRFWTGLTAAIENLWSPSTSATDRTSRLHRDSASAAT